MSAVPVFWLVGPSPLAQLAMAEREHSLYSRENWRKPDDASPVACFPERREKKERMREQVQPRRLNQSISYQACMCIRVLLVGM